MGYNFQSMIGSDVSEEIAQSICFALMEFSLTTPFTESLDKGAQRSILDLSKVPFLAQFDEDQLAEILDRMPEDYLSSLAGRPVHKMANYVSAIAI